MLLVRCEGRLLLAHSLFEQQGLHTHSPLRAASERRHLQKLTHNAIRRVFRARLEVGERVGVEETLHGEKMEKNLEHSIHVTTVSEIVEPAGVGTDVFDTLHTVGVALSFSPHTHTHQ